MLQTLTAFSFFLNRHKFTNKQADIRPICLLFSLMNAGIRQYQLCANAKNGSTSNCGFCFTHWGGIEDVKDFLRILSDCYWAEVQHWITLWFFILREQISQLQIWITGWKGEQRWFQTKLTMAPYPTLISNHTYHKLLCIVRMCQEIKHIVIRTNMDWP